MNHGPITTRSLFVGQVVAVAVVTEDMELP